MARTVDDVEQALADLLANYSVPKGNGWEPLPQLRAYYADVLAPSERPLMVAALRRWLSPEEYRRPSPAAPADLWLIAQALVADLRLTTLVPDLEALAEVAKAETPAPAGFYTAQGLRDAARRARA